MSEMHKQNIFNSERCGNVDDVGNVDTAMSEMPALGCELCIKYRETLLNIFL